MCTNISNQIQFSSPLRLIYVKMQHFNINAASWMQKKGIEKAMRMQNSEWTKITK